MSYGVTFIVIAEGGVPVYSYPRVKRKRENLFSFLFGAFTSLSEAIWEAKGLIKLERGGKLLITDKREKVFFSFVIDSFVDEEEVGTLLETTTEAFIKRFGNTPSELAHLKDAERKEFSTWFKNHIEPKLASLTSHGKRGEPKKTFLASAKRFLLRKRPIDKISRFISNHNYFKVEDIVRELPFTKQKALALLSELGDRVIPSSKTEYFYSRHYWSTLKEKTRTMLEQKNKVSLNELATELSLPPSDVERILASLNVQKIQWLAPDQITRIVYVWHSMERLLQEITQTVHHHKKVELSELSTELKLPIKTLKELLQEAKGDVYTFVSPNVYSKSYVEHIRETARKLFEERLHYGQKETAKKFGVPLEDLKIILEDFPLIQLENPRHWYWKPTLDKLKEETERLTAEASCYTIEDIRREMTIPYSDAKKLLKDLDFKEVPLEEWRIPTLSEGQKELTTKVLDRIRKMPGNTIQIVKLLLDNKKRVPAKEVTSICSGYVRSYLKQVELLSEDFTKKGKMFVLRLDAFLNRQFGITPNQQLLNAISYRLYEEL